MGREFVSRWAILEELAGDIRRAGWQDDATPHEIAIRLYEAGWRPGGDDA